jgi:hypothetical protein
VVRRGLFIASAIVLAVAALVAVLRGPAGADITREEVVEAFVREGFALSGPPIPLLQADAEVLMPSNGEPFMVFVAKTEAVARKYYEPYETIGPTPGTFDLSPERADDLGLWPDEAAESAHPGSHGLARPRELMIGAPGIESR